LLRYKLKVWKIGIGMYIKVQEEFRNLPGCDQKRTLVYILVKMLSARYGDACL
jgi:hypothetical protein